jgi:ABC-2 type transport system ATP-binding protein
VDVELRQGLWAFVRRLNRAGHPIVVTTQSLDDAQELCNRIAKLKAGRVVALDDKHALLNRLADVRVSARLQGALPQALRERVIATDGARVTLRLGSADEVEGVLAALRAGGCAIDELEVGRADLEDVFLQLMAEPATDADPTAPARRPA